MVLHSTLFYHISPPNFSNFDKCRLPPVLHSNHSPRWLNSSQWGQVNNNTIHMYKYYFRNPRNIQIYLDISSNPEILNLDMCMFNCRSRRGKPRGPPGSRELQTALKGKNHQKILICTNLYETYFAGCEDPLFTDFIRRCLEWDPATRMTPNAALRYTYHQFSHSSHYQHHHLFLHHSNCHENDEIVTNYTFLRHAWLRRRLPRPPQVKSMAVLSIC